MITPPHNKDAERAVIGSCLLDSDAMVDAQQVGLAADHFYADGHRIIWRHLCDLQRQGAALDVITLSESLQSAGELERVGGLVVVAGLTSGVPTAAHGEHYARIVVRCAAQRQIQRIAAELVHEAATADDPGALVASASTRLQLAAEGACPGSTVTVREGLQALYTRLSEWDEDAPEPGVSWSLKSVDDFCGRLQPADLVIVAARPAMGKTALGLQIARAVAEDPDRGGALVVSLEMGALGLCARLLAEKINAAGGNTSAGEIIRKPGKAARWLQRAVPALMALRNAELHIADASTTAVGSIAARARELDRRLRQRGQRLEVVVVDYLQLVGSGESGDKGKNREREVAEVSRSLKLLARQLDIPVVALAQLNRGVEQRANKRPVLSDLRESGSIEQDADLVAFVYRDDYYNPESDNPGTAEIIIGKDRWGQTGTVTVGWHGPSTRFADLEGEQ